MNILTNISDWWKRITYTEPDEEQLKKALLRVLADDPETSRIFDGMKKHYGENTGETSTFSIITGTCPGDTEAQTMVYPSGVEIVVDVAKVRRMRDSLEAVLGHELRHAYEAFEMGLDAYIQKVNGEGGKDWWHKDVEISAIAAEDQLRARLLATGKYNTIAPTRAGQNRRAHI
jgi:hypothetical protein